MQSFTRSLLLALALTTGAWVPVQAQTFEQSESADKRKEDQQGAAWYRKAAEQGDVGAQTTMGMLYFSGRGVPKDYQQAMVWFRKAAEQGNADAQYLLGGMYDEGRGVPKDDQQAVVWYRKAAERGLANAQTNLGLMYFRGTGVPKDEELAYFWWLLSSAQGSKSAVKNRDIVERDLLPAQRANAQAAARVWKPK